MTQLNCSFLSKIGDDYTNSLVHICFLWQLHTQAHSHLWNVYPPHFIQKSTAASTLWEILHKGMVSRQIQYEAKPSAILASLPCPYAIFSCRAMVLLLFYCKYMEKYFGTIFSRGNIAHNARYGKKIKHGSALSSCMDSYNVFFALLVHEYK